MVRRTALLPMLLGALVLGACDNPAGNLDQARVRVELTDAPSDYVAAAVVSIGRIELLSPGAPPLTVVEDGGTYDLLQLQNGVTADLGSIDVEPGTYTQLRMIVESAEITLAEGFTFTDGTTTKRIAVPSGAQTGIKITLTDGESDEAGIEIRPGETVLVVDFDVSSNFVMQGDAETPAGIQGFNFTPSLRAVVKDVAGSIAGKVTAPEGVAIEGLSVTATREGAAEDEAPAAALVAADGTFKINFVAPGTYTVTLPTPPTGHTASSVQVTVGDAQHVTGVELTLTAS